MRTRTLLRKTSVPDSLLAKGLLLLMLCSLLQGQACLPWYYYDSGYYWSDGGSGGSSGGSSSGGGGGGSVGTCPSAWEWESRQEDNADGIQDSYIDQAAYMKSVGVREGAQPYYDLGISLRTMANSMIDWANSEWSSACDPQYQAYKRAIKSKLSTWDSAWGRYNPSSPALHSWAH